MIFLPVFSKYVLNIIRNIFPIQKRQPMIQIFSYAFNYDNIFLKSKINMHQQDKKGNFQMEKVKKCFLVFLAIQYAVLKFTCH